MDVVNTTSTGTGKLRLFISYSRSDTDFADELVSGLEFDSAFDVAMDRHSIIEGEDWKKRLGALIADSDTVVFLLSPKSAASSICRWEVEEAIRLTKRIVPILVAPLVGRKRLRHWPR
jgi:TIR domain-containing protein